MVKKLNRDAFLIKILLDKGLKQSDIVKILNISFQKVNYWAKTDLKTTRKRRKKLPEEYFQKILDLANNQTTSAMSSRKIASIINAELENQNIVDRNNKPLTINHTTICNYLKDYYGNEDAKYYLSQDIDYYKIVLCSLGILSSSCQLNSGKHLEK